MSNNLYPPLIERNLPPIQQIENNSIFEYKFNIPFQHNIAATNNFESMIIRITGISGNSYGIGYLITVPNLSENISNNRITYQTSEGYKETDFDENHLSNLSFNVGQFYKIQLAYKYPNTSSVVYSTIGTAKCIELTNDSPKVQILECEAENESSAITRTLLTSFTGQYYNDDGSERILSYEFNVYDSENNLYATSGKQIHDTFLSNKDVINKNGAITATDKYELNKVLVINKTYHIEYKVYTVNGLELSTQRYSIINDNMIKPEITGFLIAENNYEDGSIEVKLKPNTLIEGAEPQTTTGAFKLSRASEKDDFVSWTEILSFQLVNQIPNLNLWTDYTVEQGVKYKYAIQQYNDNKVYSSKLPSESLMADFEDAFLFDGERQLNIKYNPKITNFKTVKIEGKTDTLGGKFPFISVNGYTNYKNFSISGLISIFMDENETFVKHDTTKSWDLSGENMKKERDFKLEILDWLNDGKPKLFKSPAEGNYIVILQGVSLSPSDQLGRMLHTFSATAYEICDYTIDNLKKYNLFKGNDIISNSYYLESIILPEITTDDNTKTRYGVFPETDDDTITYIIRFPTYQVRDIVCKDLSPFSSIQITRQIDNNTTDTKTYYIGRTHSLSLNGIDHITKIEINNIPHKPYLLNKPDLLNTASIDVFYQMPTEKSFKNLDSMESKNILLKEVFGGKDGTWLIGGNYFKDENDNYYTSLLEPETTITRNNTTMYQKTHVLHLNILRLRAKDIDTTMHYTHGYTGTTYYKTEFCDSSQTISIKKSPTRIYRAKNVDNGVYYYFTFKCSNNGTLTREYFMTLERKARINNKVYNPEDFALMQDDQFLQNDLDGVIVLWIGNGIIADLCYPASVAVYRNQE